MEIYSSSLAIKGGLHQKLRRGAPEIKGGVHQKLKKFDQGILESKNPRLVKRVEESFRRLDTKRYPEQFDHYAPAQYLADNRAVLEKLPDADTAFKRFAKLFTVIG